MGIQVRDARQMKALTGLSQAQFDDLLPVFSDIYGATQQKHYEEGVASGTRRRKPGGGTKGKLPTMTEKLLFVLQRFPENLYVIENRWFINTCFRKHNSYKINGICSF